MKSFIAVVLCASLAIVNAGILHSAALVGPAAEGVVLQGPGSSASVQGPDGSVISSVQPGGAVVAAPRAAGLVAGVAPAAALVAPAAPIVAAHGALVGAPLIGAPVIAAGAPLARIYGSAGYPLTAPGSGLEGQYIPDNLESLYDSGEYHGEIYA